MDIGDGSISFDEFRELMTRYEQTSPAAAAANSTDYCHHHHPSSDDPVSGTGAPQSISAASGRLDVPVDSGDELRDAFQVFDKDKDGFLNATDLRYASVVLQRRYTKPIRAPRTGSSSCIKGPDRTVRSGGPFLCQTM